MCLHDVCYYAKCCYGVPHCAASSHTQCHQKEDCHCTLCSYIWCCDSEFCDAECGDVYVEHHHTVSLRVLLLSVVMLSIAKFESVWQHIDIKKRLDIPNK
jgi:hypothetical protein